jgi:hypothetical protein
MKKRVYEAPEIEVIILSIEGNVCNEVSDFRGFGEEEDWDQ